MPPGTIEVDVEIAAAAAAAAEAAIDAPRLGGRVRRAPATCWRSTCRPSCPTATARGWPSAGASWRPCACARSRCSARRACARAAASSATAEQAARAAIAGDAVPRVGAPAADGGARGGGEPGRGAARLRGAAHPAARRARHHARARPRWPSTSGSCAARRPRPGPPTPRADKIPVGRLAGAARRRARPPRARRTRARARRARGALGRGGRRHPPARPAGRRRRHRQDPPGRRARAAAPATTARCVLYGRFDEEAIAPYQPVVEMVRGWSSGASLEPLRERLGVRAAELGILFGELGPPPADDGGLPHGTTRRRRLRFFDAVAALLGEAGATGAARARLRRPALGRPPDAPAAAAPRPLAAAAPRAAARHLPRGRARAGPPAARADRRRPPRRACSSTSRWAAWPSPRWPSSSPRSACRRAEPAFVHALHGETEGNPFFIEEVVRHLRESDHDAARPTSRSPRRASRTACARSPRGACGGSAPSRARRSQVAAVIGREFDYDVLAGGRAARGGRADQRARGGRRGAACCARRAVSAATRSRTRSCARRSTTGSRSCAARGCTAASARRSRACAAPTSTRTCRSSPTTSRRRRRSSSPSARSTSRSPPPAAPTASSPGRRPPSTTAPRCARASWPASSRTRCAPSCCSRRAPPRTAPAWRRRRGPRSRARPRPRACSATVAARPGGARLRRPVVGPRARRRGAAGAARGGAGRRSATRTARCARGCWRGSRSSSTTRATRSGGWRCPSRRSTSRGGSATRARSPPASTPATTRCGGRRT